MANTRPAPIIALTGAQKTALTVLDSDIARARQALETLKGLGMDVKEIEEKLTWAENVRATLLKEFS